MSWSLVALVRCMCVRISIVVHGCIRCARRMEDGVCVPLPLDHFFFCFPAGGFIDVSNSAFFSSHTGACGTYHDDCRLGREAGILVKVTCIAFPGKNAAYLGLNPDCHDPRGLLMILREGNLKYNPLVLSRSSFFCTKCCRMSARLTALPKCQRIRTTNS
jgi:hypothetical protein